jgi:hypothetical protein
MILSNKKSSIYIGIFSTLMVLIGIVTAVLGIIRIQNYNHPYFFGFILGSLGILCGLTISTKLKTFLRLSKKQKSDFWLPRMFLTAGFIGVFLLIGSTINKGLSKVDICDDYNVIDKYRIKRGYRTPEINYLTVNINGHSIKVISSHDYWDNTSIGQKINLCSYKSKIGFDFMEITLDKF